MDDENVIAEHALLRDQQHTLRERLHLVERRLHDIELAQHAGAARADVHGDSIADIRRTLDAILADMEAKEGP